MALNVNDIGVPVARIKNNPKYKDVVFSVTNDNVKNGFDEFTIDDGEFQILPNVKADRSTVFIAGTEGAGKSVFISNYIKEYARIYKKNPIYLISEKDYDECLDSIKNVKRIDLTGIEDDNVNYNEFADSCVIFDDCDAFTGKLRKYLDELRDKLLKNARSNRTTVIISSHSFSGRDLQPTLNNCKVIVFFLNDLTKSLRYMIDNFIGLDTAQIKSLKKNNSRWTAYMKTFPNIIVQQKKIMSLDSLQDF